MMVPQLAVLVDPLKPTAVPWMCEDDAAGALMTAVGFMLQAEAVGALRSDAASVAMRAI
jgi:hypothetical protein